MKSSKPEPNPVLLSDRYDTGLLTTLPLSHGTRAWIDLNLTSQKKITNPNGK